MTSLRVSLLKPPQHLHFCTVPERPLTASKLFINAMGITVHMSTVNVAENVQQTDLLLVQTAQELPLMKYLKARQCLLTEFLAQTRNASEVSPS